MGCYITYHKFLTAQGAFEGGEGGPSLRKMCEGRYENLGKLIISAVQELQVAGILQLVCFS